MFFERYHDGFSWLAVAAVIRPEVERIRELQRKRRSIEAPEERSPKRRETSLRSDSDKSMERRWEAILVTES